MKEPELFNTNHDETVVEISAESREKFEKEQEELLGRLGFLRTLMNSERGLTVEMRGTMLSLVEHCFENMCEAIGFNTPHQKEVEEMRCRLRAANVENRELRRQLGEKVSLEDMRENIKLIAYGFERWWSTKGFGWCTDFNIGSYGGIECRCVCRVGYGYDNDESEVMQRLKVYGFEIDKVRGGGCYPLATTKNVELMEKLCKELSPDCKIWRMEIQPGYHEYTPYIDEVIVHLRTLDCLAPYIEDHRKYIAEEEQRELEKANNKNA